MITCSNVVCRTDAGGPLFNGLCLETGDAPLTVIMGGNGSGKTALGLLLAGVRLPDAGEILVDGRSPVPAPGEPRRVGLVFQNPDDQFTAVTVERELAFGLENLGVPRERMRPLVEEYLERYGLAPFRSLSPHLLSGGEKRRLALGAVLITSPAYVVLDEPFAMMEPAAANILRGYVRECTAAGVKAVLLSKDPADAVPAGAVRVLSGGCLAPLPSGGALPPELRYPPPLEDSGGGGAELLSARGVSFGYGRGSRGILSELSLTVTAGRRHLITGPAGSGKTTLLSLLAGQLRPQTGTVAWRGADIRSRAGRRALREGCAYGFQFPEEQFFAHSVDEELRFTARERNVDNAALEERIAGWAGLLGWDMVSLGPRPPWSLDYGSRRILAVISLLAHGPALVLLDEPFAGLDGNGVRNLQRILARAEREGTALAVAGHAAAHPFLQAGRQVALAGPARHRHFA